MLAMADGSGDLLWALYNAGDDATERLVTLIHAPAGSEDSRYIPVSARYLLAQG
jgi:hypothetical protein